MAGLLDSVLPAIFSAGNKAQRVVKGLLADPVGTLQQSVDTVMPTGYERQQWWQQMTGNRGNTVAADAARQKMDELAQNAAQMGAMIKLVYHGTSGAPFDEFVTSRRGSMTEAPDAYGATFVADSKHGASPYADWASQKTGEDARILSAYLKAKNPLVLGTEFTKDNSVKGLLLERLLNDKSAAYEYAKKHGHDVIYYPQGNANDLPGTFAVFDNANLRIKNHDVR